MNAPHATPTSVREFTLSEFVLLWLFGLSLPLFEGPKNIFLGLFALLWCFNSIRLRNWGRMPASWTCTFLAIGIVAVISAYGSPMFPVNQRDLGDILSCMILALIVLRTHMNARLLFIFCACLIGATLGGIVEGSWMWWSDPHRIALQLKSVGQQNHSALYVMGICMIALATLLPYWRVLNRAARVASILLALALTASLVAFGSRAALLILILAAAIFVFRHQKRVALPLTPVLLACGIVAAVVVVIQHDMVRKTLENFSAGGSITAMRAETTATAFETWRHSKLIGIGPGNLPQIGEDQLRQWIEARHETFDAQRYVNHLHAHNLYFNTLAERGILGLAALLGLGVMWALALVRRAPGVHDEALSWTRWGIGLGGFVLVFGGGLFNTTFHHEHGMLAILCLGMLLDGFPHASQQSHPHHPA